MNTRVGRAGVVAAIAGVLIVGAGFVFAQQAIRQAADHPQVELARGAASKLDAGATPNSVLPAEAVDMSSSAGTYLIVVGPTGAILASSATLRGAPIEPPSGVFAYVSAHGEDRISWQPAPDVRSAIVVDGYRGGFVVAGRSLTETEARESSLLLWAPVAWAAIVALAAGLAALTSRRRQTS